MPRGVILELLLSHARSDRSSDSALPGRCFQLVLVHPSLVGWTQFLLHDFIAYMGVCPIFLGAVTST